MSLALPGGSSVRLCGRWVFRIQGNTSTPWYTPGLCVYRAILFVCLLLAHAVSLPCTLFGFFLHPKTLKEPSHLLPLFPNNQMSESAIFNSVKQLDLRSTKHATAEKIRGMMIARKTAIATISAAPSTGVVVRPSTAASTTSSGSTFRPSRSPQGNATLRRIQPEQHYAPAPAPAPALPGVDAGALEAATEAATAAQAQLLALEAKCSQLEGCLGDTCQAFSNYVEATETPSSEYYTVAFPAGAIGEWVFIFILFTPFFFNLFFAPSPLPLPSPSPHLIALPSFLFTPLFPTLPSQA